MATVKQIIERLFPNGTNAGDPSHRYFPVWPPDMFAVTAKLIETSGCYTYTRFGGFGRDSLLHDHNRIVRVQFLAAKWTDHSFSLLTAGGNATDNETKEAVEKLQELWEVLTNAGEQEVKRFSKPSQQTLAWWEAALMLLSIADEASGGVGFPPRPGGDQRDKHRVFADYVLEQYKQVLPPTSGAKRKTPKVRKGMPTAEKGRLNLPMLSLCLMVPPEELCVQAKATTPHSGCSLRNLTHHLALLPPNGDVASCWMILPRSIQADPDDHAILDHPLNLLLVPFPYEVDAKAFFPNGSAVGNRGPRDLRVQEGGKPNFFSVEQTWLKELAESQFADFLLELIEEAHREVEIVHGVVLPELALNKDFAAKVAAILADKTRLEFFITGTSSTEANSNEPTNTAHTFLFFKKQIWRQWEQAKHHRWKLDKQQIRREI